MNKRVLVIEDDAVMRAVTEGLLEVEDYDVITAADGLAGVYAAFDYHPDLILLDLSMPRMGGWDVVNMLRSDPRTREIPVIVMTALAGPEHRERAQKQGCAGFLSKPFDVQEMLQALSVI